MAHCAMKSFALDCLLATSAALLLFATLACHSTGPTEKLKEFKKGLWRQVIDQGGKEGNHLEVTPSATFVCSMAKAVNKGCLSRDYIPAIVKGYNGIINKLIKTDGLGRVSLTKCCSVAGLGYWRNGSYEYYLHEPVVDNVLKGSGPFILGGIEIQKLLDLPMTSSHGSSSQHAPNSVSLFNGRDLSGWTVMNDAKFLVTNGVLHLDASWGWLCTEEVFTNFILEAECRALQTNYNSGFFIRTGKEGKPFPPAAWQINLKESALGALLLGKNTIISNCLPAKPVGEWFKFRITVSGCSAALDADGARIWKYDKLDAGAGNIGLQAEGKSFEFRNLRLSPAGDHDL